MYLQAMDDSNDPTDQAATEAGEDGQTEVAWWPLLIDEGICGSGLCLNNLQSQARIIHGNEPNQLWVYFSNFSMAN